LISSAIILAASTDSLTIFSNLSLSSESILSPSYSFSCSIINASIILSLASPLVFMFILANNIYLDKLM
jgi:hypothetical protein